jgi:uncharacterized coiled-coil DUF342 family protein
MELATESFTPSKHGDFAADSASRQAPTPATGKSSRTFTTKTTMIETIDESLNMKSSGTATKGDRPVSTSSSSSSGSNKRKSFEEPPNLADQENNSPNVPRSSKSVVEEKVPQSATKKFKDALLSGGHVVINAVTKGMDDVHSAMSLRNKGSSALPRYSHATAVKKIMAPIATTVPTPAKEKKRLVTEQNTAERPAPTPRKTPMRKENSASSFSLDDDKMLAPSSSTNAMIRRLKKAISVTPTPEVIRSAFDTGFSVHEDRINTIMKHCKVKSKWDFKEKAAKQDAVIKELRDCITLTFAEIKTVREQCLLQETHVNNLIRDSYEEFLEVNQTMNTLHSTALNAKQELLKVHDELKNTSSTMMKFKTEASPMRNRNKEYESRITELQFQLTVDETKFEQMSHELAKTEKELAELKIKSEQAIHTQKEDFDQVLFQ